MSDLSDIARRAYRYAVALTGDPAEAEDVLQDAWAAVIAAGGPRDLPYVLCAVRTRWIDARRRVAGRPWALAEAELPVCPEAERLILADALWAGLLTLRAAEREALYLHLVEGWTAAEIAERTAQPRNTVLSHLHRGRARLKAWLQRNLEEAG